MGEIREVVSGGETSSSSDELWRIPREERKQLLQDPGFSIYEDKIEAREVLALKTDLTIPWHKMRALRRYRCFISSPMRNQMLVDPHSISRWLSTADYDSHVRATKEHLIRHGVQQYDSRVYAIFSFPLPKGGQEL